MTHTSSIVEWTAWPLARAPQRGVLAALVSVGCMWGIWNWTADFKLVALGFLVPAVTTASFFVRTHYRVTREGIEVRRPWRSWQRPWSDFSDFQSDGRLLVLEPRVRSRWLAGLRRETVFLEERGTEVLDYVEEMVGTSHVEGHARA